MTLSKRKQQLKRCREIAKLRRAAIASAITDLQPSESASREKTSPNNDHQNEANDDNQHEHMDREGLATDSNKEPVSEPTNNATADIPQVPQLSRKKLYVSPPSTPRKRRKE